MTRTLVLGLDTATSGCSVALVDADRCLASHAQEMARGQSEALAPMIAKVFADAGVAPAAIAAVAVTRGPGAFTGLRIGLAAARAFALALNKPCIGIGTCDALAAQAVAADPAIGGGEALLVAVETKREDIYVALYDAHARLLAPATALGLGDLRNFVRGYAKIAVSGDGAARAAAALSDVPVTVLGNAYLPDAKIVARLGFAHLQAPGEAPATPLYLRPPDVTPPNT